MYYTLVIENEVIMSSYWLSDVIYYANEIKNVSMIIFDPAGQIEYYVNNGKFIRN